jgi:hypothetical protein
MESNKIIVQLAWILSGNYKYGYNIECLCTDMAKDYGLDSEQLSEAIYDGLEQLSETIYVFWQNNCATNYREISKYGYCRINDIDCYWYWTESNDGEWSSEMPDFWEEMIENYNRQN